jgi:hypothetical protein
MTNRDQVTYLLESEGTSLQHGGIDWIIVVLSEEDIDTMNIRRRNIGGVAI